MFEKNCCVRCLLFIDGDFKSVPPHCGKIEKLKHKNKKSCLVGGGSWHTYIHSFIHTGEGREFISHEPVCATRSFRICRVFFFFFGPSCVAFTFFSLLYGTYSIQQYFYPFDGVAASLAKASKVMNEFPSGFFVVAVSQNQHSGEREREETHGGLVSGCWRTDSRV